MEKPEELETMLYCHKDIKKLYKRLYKAKPENRKQIQVKILENAEKYIKAAMITENFLYRLPSEKQIDIISLRYISGYKWTDIQKELKTNIKSIHKLHNRAIINYIEIKEANRKPIGNRKE